MVRLFWLEDVLKSTIFINIVLFFVILPAINTIVYHNIVVAGFLGKSSIYEAFFMLGRTGGFYYTLGEPKVA